MLEQNANAAQNTGKKFEKAHQNAERARSAYEAARKRLNEHVTSHGCE
jgi:hypothetical protein